MILIYSTVNLFADAMFNSILHQCLQHHWWHWLIKCIFIDLILHSKTVFKTHIFQCQVILYNIQFFFQ